MTGHTTSAAGPPGRGLSERDRRFVLLAAMLAPGPLRVVRRRRTRVDALMENAMDREEQAHEQPVVTETNKERVRAGVTGQNVRTVLIVSVALVIVAFIAVAMLMRR